MSKQQERLAAFVKRLGGAEYVNPYTFKLQPAEVVLMLALDKHKTIDIHKMTGLEMNSVRVQISRLRKKLPKGVTIETVYGGRYFLPPESKQALSKYRRAA